MKKIIILILGLIIMSGCEKTINTPTSKVEDLLNQYQNLSTSISYKTKRTRHPMHGETSPECRVPKINRTVLCIITNMLAK